MTELAEVIKADRQVKSKQRVADHGEVFTSEREVKAMLDLVKDETERIDSRFLEPACGTGNFLVEVLRRKLVVVTNQYAKRQPKWELDAAQAVSSIYGVDILQDNVAECRERLFQLINQQYSQLFNERCTEVYRITVRFLLERNILWGDALNLCTPDDKAEPITFSEWGFTGNKVKRRDYTMDKLLKNQPMDGPNLFSDLGDQAFIPTPKKEYPLTHFLQITDDAHHHELQPGRTDLSGQPE